VVAYKSLKTKEKFSWIIPKVVAVAYGRDCSRELFITKFKFQFKRGFTKVVEPRTGRLREWSQGELRLHFTQWFIYLRVQIVGNLSLYASTSCMMTHRWRGVTRDRDKKNHILIWTMFGHKNDTHQPLFYQIAKIKRCGNGRSRNLTYKFCTGTHYSSPAFVWNVDRLCRGRAFCDVKMLKL